MTSGTERNVVIGTPGRFVPREEVSCVPVRVVELRVRGRSVFRFCCAPTPRQSRHPETFITFGFKGPHCAVNGAPPSAMPGIFFLFSSSSFYFLLVFLFISYREPRSAVCALKYSLDSFHSSFRLPCRGPSVLDEPRDGEDVRGDERDLGRQEEARAEEDLIFF